MKASKKKPAKRYFGDEFLAAQREVMARLPKKYHKDVSDLLDKLQIWSITVFLNIHGESIKQLERERGEGGAK